MADLITNNYQGTTITVALTGLPITITGEVIKGQHDTVVLRLKDGKIVNIAPSLIAFFF
ncbi:hypothetical protein [Clostridium baratii]|uniref:hypothetical protein n=1 Tax=Clostridium baratii TaxID=1561 RepID=UPI001555BA42|nr:hypothetical protein [Clostridium baratii]